MVSLIYIYIYNLKYNTNESIYKTRTDTDLEHRLVASKRDVDEGGMD